MKIKQELKFSHKQFIHYTPKLVDYFSKGSTFTKEEYEKGMLFCNNCDHDDDSFKHETTFYYEFQFLTTLNENMFQWSLSITGYEVYFRLYPSYQKKQYYTLLDNTKQLYSFYEFLYNESSVRLKILSEFGPKIPFEDFENRFKATKNWK